MKIKYVVAGITVLAACPFIGYGMTALAISPDPVPAAAVEPWVYVPHAGYIQPTAVSCNPTSAAMALTSLGVSKTPEDVMRQSGAETRGMTVAELVAVMNKDQPRGWTFGTRIVRSPADLTDSIAQAIDHGAALPETVFVQKLPYALGFSPTVHEVLVDGLDTETGKVRIYDPTSYLPDHGHHTMTVDQFYRALFTYKGDRWSNTDRRN